MLIVVTGNIGWGKTTATQYLAELLPEFKLVNIDDLVRSLYTDDNARAQDFVNDVKRAINTPEIYDLNGDALRKYVSDYAFKNPPFIKRLIKRSALALESKLVHAMYRKDVILEHALCFELDNVSQYHDVHCTVAVTCEPDIQMDRVKSRDGISDEKIRSIMGQQLSSLAKATLSDFEVDTTLGIDDMKRQVRHVADHIRRQQLEKRFTKFWSPNNESLGASASAAARRMWKQIRDHYSEPHRKYHGLNHLVHMFQEFDRVRDHINNPIAVEAAIWFHDIIFTTQFPDYYKNEINSAKKFWSVLSSFSTKSSIFTHDTALFVVELILATKSHSTSSFYIQGDPGRLSDCEIFLDIDLHSLGAPEDVALKIDLMVEAEFSNVEQNQYSQGRIDVMSKFLKRPKLFWSPHYAHLEAQARSNIRKIIRRQCERLLDYSKQRTSTHNHNLYAEAMDEFLKKVDNDFKPI